MSSSRSCTVRPACSSITTRARRHSSGKLLYSARIIPYRGSWLDFEFDPKDNLFARIDRRRKLPVTVVLRALGYNNEQMLAMFHEQNLFRLDADGASMDLVPERLKGEKAAVRHHCRRRQGAGRAGQADHRSPHQADRRGRPQAPGRAGQLPRSARSSRVTWWPADTGEVAGRRQHRDHRAACSPKLRAAGRREVPALYVNDVGRGAVHLHDAEHRSDQDTSWRRWSKSIA